MRIHALLSLCAFVLALGLPQRQALAALVTYTDAAQFAAATGNPTIESFEQLAPRTRSTAPIVVPTFSLSSATPVGVQNGSNSPESGFGSFATDGVQYLLVYQPNQPAGTLRFDLAHPTTAFGFYITDNGETDGELSLSSNAGETLNSLTLAQFPPIFGNGSQLFFGFTQTTPFTQIFLTSTGIDDSYGLDQVYVQTVPLPSALWLFLSGLPVLRRLRLRPQ